MSRKLQSLKDLQLFMNIQRNYRGSFMKHCTRSYSMNIHDTTINRWQCFHGQTEQHVSQLIVGLEKSQKEKAMTQFKSRQLPRHQRTISHSPPDVLCLFGRIFDVQKSTFIQHSLEYVTAIWIPLIFNFAPLGSLFFCLCVPSYPPGKKATV